MKRHWYWLKMTVSQESAVRMMKWIVGFGPQNSTTCSMYPPREFSSPPGDGAEGSKPDLESDYALVGCLPPKAFGSSSHA